MAGRKRFRLLLLAIPALSVTSVAQEPPPPPKSEPPVPSPTDPQTPEIPPDITVEEAVTRAKALFDLAETEEDPKKWESLLREAQALSESVRAKDASLPWWLYLSARLQMVSGRFVDAKDALRRFVETPEGRNEWSAYRLLGDLFAEEFPRLARHNYERADALKPGESRVLLGLSRCALKLSDLKTARAQAEAAVAADGRRNVRYLSHLAEVLIAEKDWTAAEEIAAAGLAIAEADRTRRPSSRKPLEALDVQYKSLLDILQSRIQETPADVDAYLRWADYRRKRAEIRRAAANHDVVDFLALGITRAGPNPPIALREAYAKALLEIGRKPEALAEFEAILAAEPGNESAREWAERLRAEAGNADGGPSQ